MTRASGSIDIAAAPDVGRECAVEPARAKTKNIEECLQRLKEAAEQTALP
jgi:hypothetical protein